MTSACYIADRRVDGISTANRGLAYGDGVFETLRVQHGTLPLWSRHLKRLCAGATRLGLALPDLAFMQAESAAMSAGVERGVLKLLLTRGEGGRGYAPPIDAPPMWMLSLHPLPAPSSTGLNLQVCETRLALQPLLAGIKHCNRLEQVLARAEVVRSGADEGLLCDMAGNVISATAANLLVLRDGRWLTPQLDACGVAGVLRGWLLEQAALRETVLGIDDVLSADALALCNAVRGILPVASLGTRHWAAHLAISDLQATLAMTYPMFGDDGVDA